MHTIVILILAALLFLMGLAVPMPYQAKLLLCSLGVFFMYAAIITAVFIDEARRGRSGGLS